MSNQGKARRKIRGNSTPTRHHFSLPAQRADRIHSTNDRQEGLYAKFRTLEHHVTFPRKLCLTEIGPWSVETASETAAMAENRC